MDFHTARRRVLQTRLHERISNIFPLHGDRILLLSETLMLYLLYPTASANLNTAKDKEKEHSNAVSGLKVVHCFEVLKEEFDLLYAQTDDTNTDITYLVQDKQIIKLE